MSSGPATAMTAAGQSSVTYVWDPASRLIQISQGSQVVTFQYDTAGRRVQRRPELHVRCRGQSQKACS